MQAGIFNALSIIKVFGAALVVMSHYGSNYLGIAFYSFGTGCFFVVAGYYALNWESTRGLHYLVKRLIRLYPGYLVAVLAYLAVRGVPLADWPMLFLHHATFLLSTPDAATVFALNPAFWSLPVFFTFFALVALLPLSFRPTLLGVLWLATLPFVAMALGWRQWQEGYVELLAWPMHFYAFWAGGWLGKLAHERERSVHAGYTVASLVLMGGIVLLGANHGALTAHELLSGHFYRTLMVAAYVALLWCMIHSPLIQRRNAVLSWLGTVSFGVYLFHNLMIPLVKPLLSGLGGFAVSLVLTLVVAWLSWTLIESPVNRFGKRLLRRWPRAGQHAERQAKAAESGAWALARWNPVVATFAAVLVCGVALRLLTLAGQAGVVFGEVVRLPAQALLQDLPWLALSVAVMALAGWCRQPVVRQLSVLSAWLLLAVYWLDVVLLMHGLERLPLWLGGHLASGMAGLMGAVLGWPALFFGMGLLLLLRLSRVAAQQLAGWKSGRWPVASAAVALLAALWVPAPPPAYAWLVESGMARPVSDAEARAAVDAARQRLKRERALQNPQIAYEIVEAGWETPLMLRSAGFALGRSGAAWVDDDLAVIAGAEVERGLTLLGLRSEGLPDVVARADPCGSMEALPRFAELMAFDGPYLGFAVIVDDSAFCRGVEDLEEVLGASALSQWRQLGFRESYVGLVLNSGDALEVRGGGSVATVVLEPRP